VAEPGVRAVLAASVRREREARGWSLNMLAARSGVGRSTIVRIERQDGSVTFDIAALLAAAFGTSIGDLADPRAEGDGGG
jgi:transcriptional regulator with XRE-family HTH domain